MDWLIPFAAGIVGCWVVAMAVVWLSLLAIPLEILAGFQQAMRDIERERKE